MSQGSATHGPSTLHITSGEFIEACHQLKRDLSQRIVPLDEKSTGLYYDINSDGSTTYTQPLPHLLGIVFPESSSHPVPRRIALAAILLASWTDTNPNSLDTLIKPFHLTMSEHGWDLGGTMSHETLDQVDYCHASTNVVHTDKVLMGTNKGSLRTGELIPMQPQHWSRVRDVPVDVQVWGSFYEVSDLPRQEPRAESPKHDVDPDGRGFEVWRDMDWALWNEAKEKMSRPE